MEQRDTSVKSLAALNFLFGIWLIISPYILGYQGAQAKWQSVVAGIVVLILAAVRYFSPAQVWASWVNALVGVWMIISPFATSYNTTAAYWNQIIFGILIAIVGISNAATHVSEQRGGSHHHAV